MNLVIRDTNGNGVQVNGFAASTLRLLDVESSRLEDLHATLSADLETIILTLTLEEV